MIGQRILSVRVVGLQIGRNTTDPFDGDHDLRRSPLSVGEVVALLIVRKGNPVIICNSLEGWLTTEIDTVGLGSSTQCTHS